MSSFFEYLPALFDHWEPLVGAVVIVVTAFVPSVEKSLAQHPNRRLLWVVLLSSCLFFAGFLAWKEEHDRYIAAVFRQIVPVVTVEGGTTYQILKDDYLLAVASIHDKTTTLKLPSNPYRGQRFEIKDANGAISPSFPIVVNGNGNNIDQKATFDMNQPAQAIAVTYNGIKWLVT
jgi:hypothetical protein